MCTSSLRRSTSSSSFLILSSYPVFSSRIIVVSVSVSHHFSRALRSSRTADSSCSLPRTRISPDVSTLSGSGSASLAPRPLPPFPLKVDLTGDEAISFSKTSVARCFPFSFHATPDDKMPLAESSCACRPVTSLTDAARDLLGTETGLGLGGRGRSGELDGPGNGTS